VGVDGDGKGVETTVNGVTTYFAGAHYEVTGSTIIKDYFAGAQRIATPALSAGRKNSALCVIRCEIVCGNMPYHGSNGGIMAEQNTTRLYLIRHGATQLSAEDRFAGAVNVELSEQGKLQAARLAERLADEPVAAVYCSPLARTVQTASILAAPHNLSLIHQDGLREIDHGHWEGMRRVDVEAQFPEEYVSWEEDPFTFAPLGGEAGVNVIARALPVIRAIVLNHRGQNVIVVSHKATLRLTISSLLGFDARGYRDRLDQSPACLNVIDFKDPVRARLMLFNDISHYADEPQRPSGHLSKWWDGSNG
jgi:probable phosphoglycerate mutase